MFYDNKAVKNFKLVQVQTSSNTGGTKYIFPDQPELRNRAIEKITTYPNEIVGNTPNNATPVGQSITTACYLVLYVNEREDIKIPLTSLVSSIGLPTGALYANVNGYVPLNDIKVIWSKSYVACPSGLAIAGNRSFIFGVFYK